MEVTQPLPFTLMVQRTITAALLALSCLACPAGAQDTLTDKTGSAPASASALAFDFSRTIVPLTELKPRGPMLEAEFGTGFCIDPDCQFIGTNYHVAVKVRHLRIRGARIVERYLATGPHDESMTLNYFASGGDPLWYNQGRDLAVFELDKPLRQHHGLRFNPDDLRIGQTVDIYAYPKGAIDPFRSLQAFHGTFKGLTTTGLLAFDYVPNGGRRIREGASGGIVVDSSTQQIVGILSGIDMHGLPIAVAVPVEALAEFLNERLPFLAGLLFPIRAVAPADQPDLYTKYDPPEAAVELQRRLVEPSAILELREKAQALAEGMRDFIAVQTFVWGNGNHRPVAADAYEVQVRDGTQEFREYPNGKKWLSNNPWPKADVSAISPGDVWSALPLFIGTHVGVKIHEADETEFLGHRVRVFQYVGSDEDNPCIVADILDLGLIPFEIRHSYTAYGEVWTDESLNFIRMSLHCEKHGRHEWEDVMTLGWFTRPEVEPRLVPVTVVAWSPNRNKGLWCRSQFVDYHEFFTRARTLHEVTPVDPLTNSVQKGGEPPRD
jgi:hypothetical protein